MTIVGATDAFERRYVAEFKARTARFGEFVFYERDRAARDIGLHLTRTMTTGAESLSTSLCWFQLKGVQDTTLPKAEAARVDTFAVDLSVRHLRFWFLQTTPTWLAFYVEALNEFYVLNLQEYVASTWGKDILKLDQATARVKIRRSSLLDDQAFALIVRAGELPSWALATTADIDELAKIQRDAGLIWRLGTANVRRVEHRMSIVDWQSKMRGEVHFSERPAGGILWSEIRWHWQLGLRAAHVAQAYPYLDFEPADESADPDDEDEYQPTLELADGEIVYGEDFAGEYNEFLLTPSLNELGRRLYTTLEELRARGLVVIDPDAAEGIDVAPWNARDV